MNESSFKSENTEYINAAPQRACCVKVAKSEPAVAPKLKVLYVSLQTSQRLHIPDQREAASDDEVVASTFITRHKQHIYVGAARSAVAVSIYIPTYSYGRKLCGRMTLFLPEGAELSLRTSQSRRCSVAL